MESKEKQTAEYLPNTFRGPIATAFSVVLRPHCCSVHRFMWYTALMSRIQVIDRAVNILNQFSEAQPFRTVDQVSRNLNLPRSTVYRILESLKENHFIERTETPGKYRLGYRIVHLAAGLHRSYDIAVIAKPYIERLKIQFNETIQLQVLSENKYGIYIIVEECADPLRVTFPLGNAMPLYAGCTVQTMLAYLSPEEQEAAIPEPIHPIGPNSITSRKALHEKLEKIRELGWASSEAEVNPGIRAYSVPIFSRSGKAEASLSIAGPADRIRSKETGIVEALLETSGMLSRKAV